MPKSLYTVNTLLSCRSILQGYSDLIVDYFDKFLPQLPILHLPYGDL